LSGSGAIAKGKAVTGSENLGDDSAFRQATERSSILKKNHGYGSMKDKAAKILADSEARTFGDLPPRTRDSFLESRYSPSTGMDHSEWEIIFELLAMGLIVNQDAVSDDND
jgi:hypothetical protein